MRYHAILLSLAFAALFALPVHTFAQRPADASGRALDQAARTEVIDELIKKLNSIYVFPDMAKKMEQALRARQAKKEYDGIISGSEFAKVLMTT